jgi:NADH/F420H2 dehydrogenase subunit C
MSEGTATEQPLPPVLERLREALPDLPFEYVPTPLDPAVAVPREHLLRLMTALKEHQGLAFDYLRCLSGVDYLDELEVVYHLRSFRHGHTIAVKVRLPAQDPRLPSVAHLWQAADWHERETWEMFGIVFEGHPDLRPLLTEEGLGYYPLRKSHPLAEIEEWQENLLEEVERLAAVAAPVGAPAPAVDERAQKVALAQRKAEVIKKAREEARAKGLSGEEERKYVQEALKRFEAETAQEAAAPAPTPAAPQRPAAAQGRPLTAEERAARIALAQRKAEVIKKAREEARAKGLSGEEERKYVQEALHRLEREGEGG